VEKLADEVAISNESINLPAAPSSFEKTTRSMTESSQHVSRKHASELIRLDSKKAECVGQVKPIEDVIQDISEDLYSSEGAYNKAMMTKLTSGHDDAPRIRMQVESLMSQVKQLTGSSLGSQGIDINDPTVTSLKADVAGLLSDNHSIKASLGGETVRIDNEAFHSPEEVQRWIVDCVGPETGAYEFFFDVVSMLESLQDSGRTSDEAMDSQAISRKANHHSVSAARMLNSFGVSVPQVMNKRNNPEPFALVPNHSKWKSNDGRSGLVESIRKQLQLWET
jgi:hypothetical protein